MRSDLNNKCYINWLASRYILNNKHALLKIFVTNFDKYIYQNLFKLFQKKFKMFKLSKLWLCKGQERTRLAVTHLKRHIKYKKSLRMKVYM